MAASIKTDLGNIVIENNVIASLAGISAMQSYGIVGMASKNAKDGIMGLLKFENLDKGIKVFIEDDKINIELHVIIEYGVKISTVAENIIDNIKFNVEKLTKLNIDSVNIIVEGVRTK